MSDLIGVYSAADQTDYLSTVGSDPAIAALAGAGAATYAANAACLVPMKAPRAISIGKLVWIAGAQSGNYDIGLYDAAGTRLWSKGSTASPAAGTITETVSPAVALPKGAKFYAAIAFDNATAQIRGITLSSAEQTKTLTGAPTSLTVSASFPLPATITPGSTTVLRLPLIVIREA